MLSFNVSGVKYTFDPETRIFRNSFDPGTHATGSVGVRVVDQLSDWLQGSQEPYAIVVDGSGAEDIENGYRLEFAGLFVDYPNVTLAVYGFPVAIEQIPLLFQMATNVNLRAFENEEEALQWLWEEGFNPDFGDYDE